MYSPDYRRLLFCIFCSLVPNFCSEDISMHYTHKAGTFLIQILAKQTLYLDDLVISGIELYGQLNYGCRLWSNCTVYYVGLIGRLLWNEEMLLQCLTTPGTLFWERLQPNQSNGVPKMRSWGQRKMCVFFKTLMEMMWLWCNLEPLLVHSHECAVIHQINSSVPSSSDLACYLISLAI